MGKQIPRRIWRDPVAGQRLTSGCDLPLSETADDLCDAKQEKILAAPVLQMPQRLQLAAMYRDRGILLAKDGLRRYLAGIDIGVILADFGIAETGTIVLVSTDEDLKDYRRKVGKALSNRFLRRAMDNFALACHAIPPDRP